MFFPYYNQSDFCKSMNILKEIYNHKTQLLLIRRSRFASSLFFKLCPIIYAKIIDYFFFFVLAANNIYDDLDLSLFVINLMATETVLDHDAHCERPEAPQIKTSYVRSWNIPTCFALLTIAASTPMNKINAQISDFQMYACNSFPTLPTLLLNIFIP